LLKPVAVEGPIGGGAAAAAGFPSRPMSVDGDDEDFTYHIEADALLDAHTYDDLGSVSDIVDNQWDDQNPGGSMMSDRKQRSSSNRGQIFCEYPVP
jgi:2C-methyl-D-erythritol 2,4-cyclodiphosphate synthase